MSGFYFGFYFAPLSASILPFPCLDWES